MSNESSSTTVVPPSPPATNTASPSAGRFAPGVTRRDNPPRPPPPPMPTPPPSPPRQPHRLGIADAVARLHLRTVVPLQQAAEPPGVARPEAHVDHLRQAREPLRL